MNSDPLIVERALPDDGQGILMLKGPLTANNLHSLQNAIRRERTRTLILDFTEVPYVDSSGLGSLVSAYVS